MPDNSILHAHEIWDPSAAAVVKKKEILKHNLQTLYTVIMSLCVAIMEDNATCH